MHCPAKEKITNRILQLLPQGHIVFKDSDQKDRDSVVIGWMDGYGTTSVSEINFQPDLIEKMQNLVDASDEASLEQHMEKISKHIVTISAKHNSQDNQPWVLNAEILAEEGQEAS